jgi:hypothetical protein
MKTPDEIWESDPQPRTDEELLDRLEEAAKAGAIPSAMRYECVFRSTKSDAFFARLDALKLQIVGVPKFSWQ